MAAVPLRVAREMVVPADPRSSNLELAEALLE